MVLAETEGFEPGNGDPAVRCFKCVFRDGVFNMSDKMTCNLSDQLNSAKPAYYHAALTRIPPRP